jgi:pyridoxamine 5'-phosphate oxidase
LVSEQSTVIENRQVLVKAQEEAAKKFEAEQRVPMPENWGGYLVIPEEIEFWRGNDIRLHDRLRFRRPREGEDFTSNPSIVVGENGWLIERLAP